MQPEVLAHHPFNTVARHCIAHLFTDGKPEAGTATGIMSLQYEQDETSREMLPALFVTSIEFRAFEQPALLVPN